MSKLGTKTKEHSDSAMCAESDRLQQLEKQQDDYYIRDDRAEVFDNLLNSVCDAVQDMIDMSREDTLNGIADAETNLVVVARLCTSVLVHRDCDTPIWKPYFNETHASRRQRGDNIYCSTPADLFVKRNAFLDEADGLVHNELFDSHERSKVINRSIPLIDDVSSTCNQKMANADGTCLTVQIKQTLEEARREDYWEKTSYLYSMLAHAIENMSSEDCQEWLQVSAEIDLCCLEQSRDSLMEQNDLNSNRSFDDKGRNAGAFLNSGKNEETHRSMQTTGKKKKRKKKRKRDKRRKGTHQPRQHPLSDLLQQLISVVTCSDDIDERGAARSVLESMFDNGVALEIDDVLCKLLCSEVLFLSNEVSRDSDDAMIVVSELLELLLKIIASFRSPLSSRHRRIIFRLVLPLHSSPGLPCFLKELTPILLHLMRKAEHGRPGTILQYLRKMAAKWPRYSPRSERAFLSEMFDILTHVYDSIDSMEQSRRTDFEIDSVVNSLDPRTRGGGMHAKEMLSTAAVEIFSSIARSLRSSHFEVAMHATSAFTECEAVRLILFSDRNRSDSRSGAQFFDNGCSARCLETVLPALLDGASYWHQGVQSRCCEVILALIRGAERGWINGRIIERNISTYYEHKPKSDRKWLEGDRIEELPARLNTSFISNSSGDDEEDVMHDNHIGGLSAMDVEIRRLDERDTHIDNVSESKYVSPKSDDGNTTKNASNESGNEKREESQNRNTDASDTEDTDYTEDSEYYETRSNRSLRSIKSNHSSVSSLAPETPPRPDAKVLLEASEREPLKDQIGHRQGIRGRKASQANSGKRRQDAREHDGLNIYEDKGFGSKEKGRFGNHHESARPSFFEDVHSSIKTPPISPSFMDMRKFSATQSPSPTRRSRRRDARTLASHVNVRDHVMSSARGSALRRAVRNRHSSHVVVRGGPAPPKFILHEGRKKRLAWGGKLTKPIVNLKNRQRHPTPILSSSSSSESEMEDEIHGLSVRDERK